MIPPLVTVDVAWPSALVTGTPISVVSLKRSMRSRSMGSSVPMTWLISTCHTAAAGLRVTATAAFCTVRSCPVFPCSVGVKERAVCTEGEHSGKAPSLSVASFLLGEAFVSLRLPSSLHRRLLILSLVPLLNFVPFASPAQQPVVGNQIGLEGLKEVPFASLSQPYVTPLGQAALSIRPTEWKHAETPNFIYHYFHDFIATPVSVEAEFYYRVVAHDLNKDTSHWERKAHIFIFEDPADWKAFQTKANLDPWTGGIHQGGSLFIQRDPSYKFKGSTLGHETAHLVVDRFFGSNVPLWLNEGYAEYISSVAYSSYNRARGYDSHPMSHPLTAASYLPLDRLTSLLTYPTAVPEVHAFYIESEKLVRFLNAADKTRFQTLLTGLSQGSLFDNALYRAYGSQYPALRQLEAAFQPYALQAALTGSAPTDAVGLLH